MAGNIPVYQVGGGLCLAWASAALVGQSVSPKAFRQQPNRNVPGLSTASEIPMFPQGRQGSPPSNHAWGQWDYVPIQV